MPEPFLRVDGRIVGMRFHTEDSDVGVLPRSSLEASSKFFFLFFRDQSALCLGSMLAKLANRFEKEGNFLLGSEFGKS